MFISPAEYLLLGAVVYLIYRVHRLERMLGERSGSRRTPVRTIGDSKVVPILKDRIEPGPFRTEPEKEQ